MSRASISPCPNAMADILSGAFQFLSVLVLGLNLSPRLALINGIEEIPFLELEGAVLIWARSGI